ncbi:mitochondrial carrier domain-containing protein [Pisolithus marmoratus]|nr:mitochondrial carrier domain-containing protein [Pisolithus marmoratus]
MEPDHGSSSEGTHLGIQKLDGTDRNRTVRVVKDIAFGSVAGMVAEVFEYPLDLAKVRLQSQVLDAAARFSGPLDCLVQTWRNEGIRGLYRGLPVPIFGAMAETAGLFLTYSQLQSLLLWCSSDVFRQPSLPELGLAAAGSGFLTSFIITPIELVKCKMQVQMLTTPPRIPDFKTYPPTFIHAVSVSSSFPRQHRHTASKRFRELPGPFSIVSNVLRVSGFKGLWVGHVATIIRETGGTSAWFVSKEFFASLLLARRIQASSLSGTQRSFTEMPRENVELLPWESAFSGALAGAVYRLSLYPADTVKSAIQTADDLRPPETFTPSEELSKRPRSFWETAKAMYKARGVRGLYAGCGMTVARAIPSSAIVFVVYDGLNQRFA